MRFDSNKFQSLNESISRLQEAKPSTGGDSSDYEGRMSRGELQTIIAHAEGVLDFIKKDDELEAWIQAKITKAADYLTSVYNYFVGETVNEAKKPMVKIALNPKKRIGHQVVSIGPGGKKTVEQSVNWPEKKEVKEASTPAWQRSAGKDPEGGLNKKGVESYRRANPGSKLQTAVTTKPSKLKHGSKKWKRRKSFCSRMQGMKSKLTSAKTANDPNSRINKSLRKWNC